MLPHNKHGVSISRRDWFASLELVTTLMSLNSCWDTYFLFQLGNLESNWRNLSYREKCPYTFPVACTWLVWVQYSMTRRDGACLGMNAFLLSCNHTRFISTFYPLGDRMKLIVYEEEYDYVLCRLLHIHWWMALFMLLKFKYYHFALLISVIYFKHVSLKNPDPVCSKSIKSVF
jgi:hypothetical protein